MLTFSNQEMEQKGHSALSLPYLKAVFTGRVALHELPYFRGAIAQKVGYEYTDFHNHLGDNQFRFQYPLIQYKCHRNRPMLVCLGSGAETVYRFFEQEDWNLTLGQRRVHLKLHDLVIEQKNLQLFPDHYYHFQLVHWLPLHKDDRHQFWQTTEAQQTQQLQKKLTGNLLSMAKGLDWMVPERLYVHIHDWYVEPAIRLKNGVFVEPISAKCSSNLHLLPYMGVGKAAGRGYGMIIPQRKPKNNNESHE